MEAVTALVVVDVQRGFVTGDAPLPSAPALLSAVSSLLSAARSAGALVVHLQNDGRPGTPDEPGTPTWELHFSPRDDEPVVRKLEDDGFAGTPLGSILESRSVKRLAVCGLMSEMCVAATARTALARSYGVVLPHDSHSTFDIPPSDAYPTEVPARTVSRVVEWSLGDQVELVPTWADVPFGAAPQRSE